MLSRVCVERAGNGDGNPHGGVCGCGHVSKMIKSPPAPLDKTWLVQQTKLQVGGWVARGVGIHQTIVVLNFTCFGIFICVNRVSHDSAPFYKGEVTRHKCHNIFWLTL